MFALTAPTAVLAVLILQAFDSGASHPLVMAALGSTVAAVAGMMWSTVLLMVRRHVGKGISQNARVVAITGAAFLASWKFKITPLPILGVATLAGMVWKRSKMNLAVLYLLLLEASMTSFSEPGMRCR